MPDSRYNLALTKIPGPAPYQAMAVGFIQRRHPRGDSQ